jgi:HPt (histidine-containing phosphotransfer) domain-containing protein
MNAHIVKPIDPTILYEELAKFLPVAAETQGAAKDDEADISQDDKDFISHFQKVKNFDAESGLYHVNNNRNMFLKILQGFVRDYGGKSFNLRSLIEQFHYEEATRIVHTIKGLCGTIGASHVQNLAATLEADLEQKQCNFSDYNLFEENLRELVDELNIVLTDIVTEQNEPVQKVDDPEAEKKLREAIVALKEAVDTCSSTQCKRILDGIEGIAFEKSQEVLLRKLKELLEDYDFSEAAEILDSLEKSLG